jgi:hypothetical protein
LGGSESPGGVLWLPGYPAATDPDALVNFYGLNIPMDYILCHNEWLGGPVHTEIEYALTVCPFCDCEPGNANGDNTINILDITYLISFLYMGGPAPVPYAICSGDANCDCTVNILDITYLIAFLYQAGAPPCTCQEWLIACGYPLRK